MIDKIKPLLFYFCMGAILVPIFQNCGEHIEGVIEDESNTEVAGERSACDQSLFDHFQATYLKSFGTYGCVTCHSSTGLRAVSPFADTDFPDDAFEDFLAKGPRNISDKVLVEGHNSGTLGYNKDAYGAELEKFRSDWVKISEACVAADTSLVTDARKVTFFNLERSGDFPRPSQDDNGNPILGADGNPIILPGTCGFNDPIMIEAIQPPHSKDLPQVDTFLWDLGEFRDDLAGVSISLDVRINSANPFEVNSFACPDQTGYRAGRVRVTSDKKIRIKNIHVRIDGDNKNVRDFFLERIVEAGAEDQPLFGVTSSMVTFPMAVHLGDTIVKDNEWTLFFEEIEVLPAQVAPENEPAP